MGFKSFEEKSRVVEDAEGFGLLGFWGWWFGRFRAWGLDSRFVLGVGSLGFDRFRFRSLCDRASARPWFRI